MSPTYIAILVIFINISNSKIWNLQDLGAIPNKKDISTCNNNTKLINDTLNNMISSGDTLLLPGNDDQIFWFNGGIYVYNLTNVTIQIDGTISYTDDRDKWPRTPSGHVLECMYFENMNGITFTSSRGPIIKGLIDGNGKRWWGAIDYLIYAENRPRLLHIHNSENILIEYIYFKNSPYWNVLLDDVINVEIHHSNVSARRDNIDYHDLYDITAFNTDGYDVSGENVYIHDCEIWNDDDCIAVKPQNGKSLRSNCSRNMVFERLNASGLGLTIGSVGPSQYHSCVDNITFRDVFMYRTFKGLYIKSDPGHPGETGQISNVLYENINMIEPTQYAIWIGPQQAIYDGCCDLLWPEDPFAPCPVPPYTVFSNITLRNVTIDSPRHSPGVILGNETAPMKNILFDHVVATNAGVRPFNGSYACDGVSNGIATGGTSPKPPCFN